MIEQVKITNQQDALVFLDKTKKMHDTCIEDILTIDNGLKITFKSLFEFKVILTAYDVVETNFKKFKENYEFIYDSTIDFENDLISFYELGKEPNDTMFIVAKTLEYQIIKNS